MTLTCSSRSLFIDRYFDFDICIIHFLPFIDHRNRSILLLNKYHKEVFSDDLLEKYCYHLQPHGVVQKYYDSGQLHYKYIYKNGKKDGFSEGWYDRREGEMEGQQAYKEKYFKGERNGLSVGWYPNGQKQHQDNYLDGKENGLSEYWYQSGHQQSKWNFLNGESNGLWETWYPNGQMIYRGMYSYVGINIPSSCYNEEYWSEDGQSMDN